MKKNESMNDESVQSLRKFNLKQIQSNIRLHIIFLSIVIIVNICLIVFIIIYQNKISQIKLKSSKRHKIIDESKKNITTFTDTIEHKIVNIFAISMNTYGNLHFSMLFDKSEEVKMTKKFVHDFTQIDEPKMILLYQGINDSDDTNVILSLINYFPNLLIIIGARNGNKFGFFFQETISLNSKNSFESYSKNCFIFSFITKNKYNCIEKGKKLEINKNNLFNIGDGDIVINYNFRTNGGIINFPFKSFEISKNDENAFIGQNGEFQILDIELYALY